MDVAFFKHIKRASYCFPRLESLDLPDDRDPPEWQWAPDELRAILARLPALRELFVSGASAAWHEMPERDRGYAVRPSILVVDQELHEMDSASLRALKRHFEGRFDVPCLAIPSFFRALRENAFEGARRIVSELGVSPLAARLGDVSPYFQASRYGRRGDELEGATALHVLACLIADWGLAPLAIEALPRPQRPGCSRGAGRTPLHLAVERSPSFVQDLLEIGADPLRPDAKGSNALHFACGRNFLDGARALLEAAARTGVDEAKLTTAKDRAGRTPLQLLSGEAAATAAAAEAQAAKAMEEDEKQRKADRADSSLSEGQRREREARRQERRQALQQPRIDCALIAVHAVEFLGLDGDQLKDMGVRRAFLEEPVWGGTGTEFLLHFAARKCTPEAVRALLDAGADPWLENRDGSTVVQFAVHERNVPLKEAIRCFAEESGIPFHQLAAPGPGPRGRPGKRARTSG
eukprot:tig00020801_g13893.t1